MNLLHYNFQKEKIREIIFQFSKVTCFGKCAFCASPAHNIINAEDHIKHMHYELIKLKNLKDRLNLNWALLLDGYINHPLLLSTYEKYNPDLNLLVGVRLDNLISS